MILSLVNTKDGTERHLTVSSARVFNSEDGEALGWWRNNNPIGMCLSMSHLRRRYTNVCAWHVEFGEIKINWIV